MSSTQSTKMMHETIKILHLALFPTGNDQMIIDVSVQTDKHLIKSRHGLPIASSPGLPRAHKKINKQRGRPGDEVLCEKEQKNTGQWSLGTRLYLNAKSMF